VTLLERIQLTNRIQGRRYQRLTGTARTIATTGITRHFHACDRHGVEPDTAAIREIIDDALAGRAVYAEQGFTPKRPFQPSHTRLVDQHWVRELLTRESFTSREAGELAGKLPHDALVFLRTGYGLVLEVIGKTERHHSAKLYRLRKTEDV
jgi:hypothetical protein